MPLKPAHWAVAVALTSVPLGQSFAGGKPVECYQEVYRPPVYHTVRERVQIQGAWVRNEVEPPIYGTRQARRLVSPEHVSYRVIPAEYDTIRERVLLSDAHKVARTVPAVTDTVYHKVKVDGRYGWEYRRIHGKLVLCKVKHAASWRTVAETVVVKAARTVYDWAPAEYGYRDRAVLVREERREAVIVPAEYAYELEQVVVRPGYTRVTEVPASYQTVTRQVVASEGGTSWERVAVPRCN